SGAGSLGHVLLHRRCRQKRRHPASAGGFLSTLVKVRGRVAASTAAGNRYLVPDRWFATSSARRVKSAVAASRAPQLSSLPISTTLLAPEITAVPLMPAAWR